MMKKRHQQIIDTKGATEMQHAEEDGHEDFDGLTNDIISDSPLQNSRCLEADQLREKLK